MKKLLLLLLCVPLIGVGQIDVGNDQTICDGDISQVIGTTSVQSSTDSYQITNITFAPEVIAGIPVSLFDDDMQGPFPIGFTFQFYGNNYTDFYVGSNGWIGFSSVQNTSLSAMTIPDSIGYVPRDCIMLSWEDLNPSTGGQVVYQTIGNAPNRKFVLTFDAVPYYSTTIPVTSQVVLYEGSNVIDNHIIDKPLHTNPSVQGIHNLLGTSAAVVSGRNATIWSANQESVRYYASGISWYDVNSGQMIGVGDTLNYSPTQSTYVVGVITDSSGQIWSDTMYIEVLNTNISTTGFSLCNGSVVLTAPSSFSTYSWSNGASTNSVLTVNTPGTYYVDCMTSNGLSCQSDPVTIYAGVIPITLSTPDSVFICQGDTVVMDGPLGFSSYSWSTGATTSSISTTSTGNYSLSVVDGNGCTGTSNTTSVSISPSTITATTTGYAICTGNLSVTLDAGSGFGSYQWYNNGAMMPNTSQTLVATVAGNYTVDVTYPTGCIATSNTITVYNATLQSPFYFFINTIGNDSLCLPNGQVTLDAGNYSTFNWSTGETSPQISVNTLGGSYSVNVTDLNGCPGVSNPPFTVYSIVNTSVISGPINPTQFQTVTYSVNPTSGSTYNWTLFGGTIESGQGTNSIDVKWTNSGMFTFSVLETDVNGCVGEEVTLLVNIIFNSVEDINFNTGTLTKITDVLGRESNEESNVPLFYIFDDGIVEKRIIME
ncbi:MAG: hypothetical protein HOB15_06165 [Flavobacteriales bacterium]|nr:hypothetical protein [Flavobacteriales bacterium]